MSMCGQDRQRNMQEGREPTGRAATAEMMAEQEQRQNGEIGEQKQCQKGEIGEQKQCQKGDIKEQED